MISRGYKAETRDVLTFFGFVNYENKVKIIRFYIADIMGQFHKAIERKYSIGAAMQGVFVNMALHDTK